ncbi:MAG: serine hydrolase [Candidatus Nanopelagicales bacterium]
MQQPRPRRPRRTLIASLVGLAVIGLMAPAANAAPTPNPSPAGVVGGGRLGEAGVLIVDLSGGAAPPPENDAEAWVVADVTTGDVLAAKNPHERLKPASTLKTLTLLSVLPELRPDQPYVAVQADAAQVGSKVGLVPDATYTVENLLYGMMLPSGNDAAHALANAVGGDAAAAALLNAQANRIGAFDTVVVNTSGLDAEGQVSSAYDLALVQANGLKDPAWRQIYGTERYAFPAGPVPEGTQRPTYEIATKNRLALADYPGTIGGKTGYTDASLRTFVAAVERDGHTLVATFMRFNGSTEAIATQAFDWAFANRDLLKPVGELVSTGRVDTSPSPTVSPVASAAPPTAQPTPTAPPTPAAEPETTAGPSAGGEESVVPVAASSQQPARSSGSWLLLGASGVLVALAMLMIGRIARGDMRRRRGGATLPRG